MTIRQPLRGLLAALFMATALLLPGLLAGCGGGGGDGGAQPQGRPQVQAPVTEPAQRASGRVGPQGGRVSATGSDGSVYTLLVPAQALAAETEITLTPVKEHAGLGLSGGFQAGVSFGPDGLSLAVPATLVIHPARPAPGAAGLLPAALHYSSAGMERTLVVEGTRASDGAPEIRVQVPHFSGVSVGWGSTAELEDWFDFGPAGGRILQAALAAAKAGDFELALAKFRLHQSDVVRPALEAATNDAELLRAMNAQSWWEAFTGWAADLSPRFQVGAPEDALHDERVATARVLEPKLRAAFDANNALCGSLPTVEERMTALRNANMFWVAAQPGVPFLLEEMGLAMRFTLPLEPERVGMDLAAASDRLCAKVVVEHITVADPMRLERPGTLSAEIKIDFGGALATLPEDFHVQLSGTLSDPVQQFTGAHPAGTPAKGYVQFGTLAKAPPKVDYELSASWIYDVADHRNSPLLSARVFKSVAVATRALVVQSGGGQVGVAGQELANPVRVSLLDGVTGEPVPGAVIEFIVAEGSGSVASTSLVTDPTGTVTNTWRLGSLGRQQVVLRSEGAADDLLEASAGITITTGALAGGTKGTAYAQTLAVAGAQDPVSWALAVGVLPPGLVLDAASGVISGTPTDTGSWPFTVQASSGGFRHSKAFSITVDAGPTIVDIDGTWILAGHYAIRDNTNNSQGSDRPLTQLLKLSGSPGPLTGALYGSPTDTRPLGLSPLTWSGGHLNCTIESNVSLHGSDPGYLVGVAGGSCDLVVDAKGQLVGTIRWNWYDQDNYTTVITITGSHR